MDYTNLSKQQMDKNRYLINFYYYYLEQILDRELSNVKSHKSSKSDEICLCSKCVFADYLQKTSSMKKEQSFQAGSYQPLYLAKFYTIFIVGSYHQILKKYINGWNDYNEITLKDVMMNLNGQILELIKYMGQHYIEKFAYTIVKVCTLIEKLESQVNHEIEVSKLRVFAHEFLHHSLGDKVHWLMLISNSESSKENFNKIWRMALSADLKDLWILNKSKRALNYFIFINSRHHKVIDKALDCLKFKSDLWFKPNKEERLNIRNLIVDKLVGSKVKQDFLIDELFDNHDQSSLEDRVLQILKLMSVYLDGKKKKFSKNDIDESMIYDWSRKRESVDEHLFQHQMGEFAYLLFSSINRVESVKKSYKLLVEGYQEQMAIEQSLQAQPVISFENIQDPDYKFSMKISFRDFPEIEYRTYSDDELKINKHLFAFYWYSLEKRVSKAFKQIKIKDQELPKDQQLLVIEAQSEMEALFNHVLDCDCMKCLIESFERETGLTIPIANAMKYKNSHLERKVSGDKTLSNKFGFNFLEDFFEMQFLEIRIQEFLKNKQQLKFTNRGITLAVMNHNQRQNSFKKDTFQSMLCQIIETTLSHIEVVKDWKVDSVLEYLVIWQNETLKMPKLQDFANYLTSIDYKNNSLQYAYLYLYKGILCDFYSRWKISGSEKLKRLLKLINSFKSSVLIQFLKGLFFTPREYERLIDRIDRLNSLNDLNKLQKPHQQSKAIQVSQSSLKNNDANRNQMIQANSSQSQSLSEENKVSQDQHLTNTLTNILNTLEASDDDTDKNVNDQGYGEDQEEEMEDYEDEEEVKSHDELNHDESDKSYDPDDDSSEKVFTGYKKRKKTN